MRCPSCGATVESVSQRFCQTCGTPLDPQQLRQQLEKQGQGSGGPFVNPQLVQGARTGLDSIGSQVNQAIATRNTGQMIAYAGVAVAVVLIVGAILHALLTIAVPLVIAIALIAYLRRDRGFRRW